MSSDAFPKSLSDIKAGSHIDGDTGDSPAKKPAWLDKEEYNKVHIFFEKNIMSLTLAWHLSITMGFSVNALLSALVFTGASSTPQSSLKRYLDTFKHLVFWHMGDVFEEGGVAFKSVQGVRGLHKAVRESMDKKVGGRTWISMYDMAIVQTGFMGAISVSPAAFGMQCSQEEISTYIYFWRCVGRQLGIADRYNLCGGGREVSTGIVQEVIHDVIFPDSLSPPEPNFDKMAGAYIAGINYALPCHFPLFSIRSVFHYMRCSLGSRDPGPPMSLADWLRYGFLVWSVAMMHRAPGFTRLGNALLLGILEREAAPPEAEELVCPATGRPPPHAKGQCQRGGLKRSSVLTLQAMVTACLVGYAATLMALLGGAAAVALLAPAWLAS